MENQNVNEAAEIAALKERMKKIQEGQNKQGGSSKNQNLKNKGFIPQQLTETFRILPPKPGKDWFETAFFHPVMINSASGVKKNAALYCPRHNDPKRPRLDKEGNPVLDGNGKPIMDYAPCPLCDEYNRIVAKKDPSVLYRKKDTLNDYEMKIFNENAEVDKRANVYKAYKYYIVKGVDKGQEKDGPKFWRFKEYFNGEGVWDKLFPIVNTYVNVRNKDFASATDGCNLTIISQYKEDKRAKTNNSKKDSKYIAVNAIIAGEPSPLHSDPVIAQQWLNDDLTWRGLYKAKTAPNITPYEYMKLWLEGNDPFYDETNKKWIFPNNPELEKKANTRKLNLDAQKNIETASDVINDYVPPVTISNVTKTDVGKFVDNSVNVAAEILTTQSKPVVEENNKEDDNSTNLNDTVNEGSENDNWDDLPF